MSNQAYGEKRYLMGEIEKAKAECERRIAEAVAAEREAILLMTKCIEEAERTYPALWNTGAGHILKPGVVAIRARSNPQPLVKGSPLQKADTHVEATSPIGESGE